MPAIIPLVQLTSLFCATSRQQQYRHRDLDEPVQKEEVSGRPPCKDRAKVTRQPLPQSGGASVTTFDGLRRAWCSALCDAQGCPAWHAALGQALWGAERDLCSSNCCACYSKHTSWEGRFFSDKSGG